MPVPKEMMPTLQQFEKEGSPLEIVSGVRKTLQESILHYTETFLNEINDAKAYEKEGYQSDGTEKVFSIDGNTHSIEEILSIVKEKVDKPGLNPPSGGQFGYIPGGGIYSAALGDYIAAVTNRYAGIFFASPGAVRLENSLINWVGKLIGYSGECGGNLTSGGSIANLIAISTARTIQKVRSKDVTTSIIYFCQQAHHSILKALKITGLDECICRVIDLDADYHLRTDLLEAQIQQDIQAGLKPFLLIADAGSTDVGAVDDLETMAAIAGKYSIWFHVDAAYGGFFLLTAQGKEKMRGIKKADSVIMDPHKGLFLPYGLGIVMVKNVHHLFEANNYDANYMQDAKIDSDEYSPAQLSPELSKHFRGLRMWIPLKLHGTAPFASALEEKILLAQYFYYKIKALGFETGPFPDLSIVLFWFVPREGVANDFNKLLMESIQKDGRVFISSTTLKGEFLLRFVALSFRTHLRQVDVLLSQMEELTKAM